MNIEFTTLIGQFIHYCGAIEFIINNSIRSFSTDNILSSDVVSSPLHKRIDILKRLLHERSEIEKEAIDGLCKDLDRLRKQRNIVAHNPIVMDGPDESANEEILVLRYKAEEVITSDKLTKEGLSKLVIEAKNIMLKFVELIPTSTAT